MERRLKEVWQEIMKRDSFLLVPHLHPDGDAIGSALGLYWSLKKLGKEVQIFNKTRPLPYFLDFLPGFQKIKDRLPTRFEVVITLDCGDFDRTGLPSRPPFLINIDHHKSNPLFGDLNLVEGGGPATSHLVYRLLKVNRAPIPKESAIALYTGILTDTGNFQYDTVTPRLFRDVAELVELGANPAWISRMVYQRVPLSRLRILSQIYDNLSLHFDGKVVKGFVTQQMFKETGATRDDVESVPNELRNLVSVEVSVFLREEENGDIKISLRSKEWVDVSQIALQLGGGGHIRAAGATIPNTTIEGAWEKLVPLLEEALKR